MKERYSLPQKRSVAREAAILLYTSQEKEYKQAKLRAAKTLGVKVLPRNAQIEYELDIIADEMEGSTRKETLFQMRSEALGIMKTLKDFHPQLIGSVWRGTARKSSDIDIVTFSSNHEAVIVRLQKGNFEIAAAEWRSAPKLTRQERSFHIYLILSSGNQAEVVVRSLDRRNEKEKCEIYGDLLTGLNRRQLERVLAEDPLKKFVP